MLKIALMLFLLTAVGGATLVFCHFRFRHLPWGIVIAHGVGGAAALVVLTLAALRMPEANLVRLAWVVLVVAAVGGFANLALNLRKAALHLPLVGLHAGIAVIGVVILVMAILSMG